MVTTGANLSRFGNNPDMEIENFQDFLDDALAHAVALSPGSADVLFAQAMMLFPADGEVEPGSSLALRIGEFFDRALRANPRHTEALHAQVALIRELDAEVDIYKRVLAIDPGHAAARANLANAYFTLGDREAGRSPIEETFRLFPDTSREYGTGLLHRMGFAEAAFANSLRDWGGRGYGRTTRRRGAIALAEMGAVAEAAALLRMNAAEWDWSAFRDWHYSQAELLEGDWEGRLQFMEAAYEAASDQRWTADEYADALIMAGRPERGLEIVRQFRPDLQDGATPEIMLPEEGAATDSEASSAALALQMLNRKAEADVIWRAIIDAPAEVRPVGWRSNIAQAIAHANLGDGASAMAELDKAYDAGFRFLYSYDSEAWLKIDFYNPAGAFALIYATSEFQEFRTKIEQENADMLMRLDGKYRFLEAIRSELKESNDEPAAD